MPFHYTAYGLRIASRRPLPELVPLDDASISGADFDAALDAALGADVEIVWADLPVPEGWLTVEGGSVLLHFSQVGTFRISGGRRIEVSPKAGVDDSTVRLPLLGAATAVLLHQRGLFAMHSSAVSVGGRAALFIGDKGQGKSTLASALYARGHDLLADDIAVITPARVPVQTAALGESENPEAASTCGSGLVVRPGFPQLKLVPDSLQATLGLDEHDLPHVSPLVDKRAHRIAERFGEGEVPLSRVYVLGVGDWELGRMPAQQALGQVLAQSYAARFGQGLLHGAAAASHFAMCARLVSSGVVRLLQRPRDLSFLAETARRIETDIAQDVASST